MPTIVKNRNADHKCEKSRYFHAGLIDHAPHLLEKSYSLRYRVYCLERGFLCAEDYPTKLESDEFDRHSLHFGAFDPAGELIATARLVQPSDAGLPLNHHCTIFSEETELHSSKNRIVEVSRLSVSRSYHRRSGEGIYGLGETTDRRMNKEPELVGNPERRNAVERRSGEKAVLTLYKSIYQVSKRQGITHWLAATEKSLQRLLVMYGFPFRPIGPQVNYFGPVTPYVMALGDFDKVLLERRIPILEEFLIGLESEFSLQQAAIDS
ncbi:MAG: PEP-CTERM/exosortase system-associated acyltransferase [Nitrosospira sp.]